MINSQNIRRIVVDLVVINFFISKILREDALLKKIAMVLVFVVC